MSHGFGSLRGRWRTMAALFWLQLLCGGPWLQPGAARGAVRPLAEAPRTLVYWPEDVSGAAEGVQAVPVDIAATGFLRGPELLLRRTPALANPGSRGARSFGGLGLFGAAPLGPLTFAAGWTWPQLPQPWGRSAQFGLSARLLYGLQLGANLTRLQAPNSGHSMSVWDLALAGRLHSAWSWSVGAEAVNAPRWMPAGYRLHRLLRVGLALRPLRGSPLLTVAADTRLRFGHGPALADTRVTLDLLPWGQGLHLFASYRREALASRAQTLWFGLSLAVGQPRGGIALAGAGSLPVARRADAPQGGAGRFALQARLQARPDARQLTPPERTVELTLAGALRRPGAYPWQAAEPVATVAVQLGRLPDELPQVDTVLLNIEALEVGLGTVDELCRALLGLRGRGVTVVARLRAAGNKEYLLAAAASRIEMDPMGALDLGGTALARNYYAQALARLGLRFEAVGVGRFKSAPDTLCQAGPRPEDAPVQRAYVDGAQQTLRAALATRPLTVTPEQVLAEGLLHARRAQALGLVDAVAPRVRLDAGESAPLPAGAPLGPVGTLARLAPAGWGAPAKVAVVPLVGMMQEHAGPTPFGAASDARRVEAALARAARDPTVVGIVLRVDSPGGDLYAAERVWRAVHEARRHKRVVASLGDVAASGGYYAALPCDRLFAERNARVGSVGIFRLKPDLSGLFARLGIQRSVTESGPHALWDGWQTPWSEADKGRLRSSLEGYYAAFVDRFAAGRRLLRDRAEELAQGRVYTGAEALALGLVDAEGGLFAAAQDVASAAGLPQAAAWQLEVLQVAGAEGPWPWLVAAASAGARQAGRQASVAAATDLWQPAAVRALLVGLEGLTASPQALWLDGLLADGADFRSRAP